MSDEILVQTANNADVSTSPAPQGYVPSKSEKKAANQKLMWDIIVTVLLSIGSVVMLLPFLWMLLATLKPDTEVYETFFPHEWSLMGYKMMWEDTKGTMEGGILRGFLNSIIATVPVVVVQIFVSAFAAYAFAKLNFKGRNVMFLVMFGTSMIPFSVIMLPQAWLFGRMQLTNGPLAIIIPKFFGSITTVFFLRQFFYGIPDSISEAARLDGAGYTKTFVSVLLPLVMPALATQAILSFIGNWNDFLGPLLFISDSNWYTLPLLVNDMTGGGSQMYVPRALATAFVSLIPIIVVFAVFQKKIVGSIVFSAVKG